MPTKASPELRKILHLYYESTGFTVTVGYGDSIAHAGHAMLYGKLHGKNQINEWTPDIEESLTQISESLSPQKKLINEGLLGKSETIPYIEELEKALPPPVKVGENSPMGNIQLNIIQKLVW